jgi:hypothetical protein
MSSLKTDAASKTAERQYLDIHLDAETMAEVERLAAEEGVTPFEMCVILLRESLAAVPDD